MDESRRVKEIVKEKYGALASRQEGQTGEGCCGSTGGCGCSGDTVVVTSEDYSRLPGYEPDADLALGCGLPTQSAAIKPGDTVVDLGSGAGNDCFVARSIVGDTGRVIGIDMTEAMILRAQGNAAKLGYGNVEFRLGDIEHLPVEDDSADVVVSNCVMNLVPDKRKAFAETFRILKPGGHFSISDIVLRGRLPERARHDAALYAGCVAGAVRKEEYLQIIHEAGFTGIQIHNERHIDIPDDVYLRSLTADELQKIRREHLGIFSITVSADKPAAAAAAR